jgi:hypothetical protein
MNLRVDLCVLKRRSRNRGARSPRVLMGILCSVLVFGAGVGEAQSAIRQQLPESYDDFQGLELALRLAQDGQVKWSKEVLLTEERAGRAPLRGSALAHRIRGLLAEEAGELVQAETELNQALQLTHQDDVRLELARVQLDRGTALQAHFTLAKVINPLQKLWSNPEGARLRLRAARDSRRHQDLLKDVDQLTRELASSANRGRVGLQASSSSDLAWMSPASLRELIGFALDLELRQQAMQLAISALQRLPATPGSIRSTAATEFAELFRKVSAVPEAEQILEAGLLLGEVEAQPFPQEDVLALRAKLAFQKGEAFTAAEFYRMLSRISPVYAHPASELSRLASWSVQAQDLAIQIPASKDRWRQQATLALADGQVAQLAAMSESFDRLFLPNLSSEDETWLYAVAYARLQMGEWRRTGESSPRQWLSRIRRGDLVEKSTQLRQAVDDCRSVLAKPCLFEFKTQL